MFNESDIKTNNHKFWMVKDKDGWQDWKSKPATKKELENARKDFKKGLESRKYHRMVIGRSCWVCNSAHSRLIDMPALDCFSCGRIYHKGIDITEYDT